MAYRGLIPIHQHSSFSLCSVQGWKCITVPTAPQRSRLIRTNLSDHWFISPLKSTSAMSRFRWGWGGSWAVFKAALGLCLCWYGDSGDFFFSMSRSLQPLLGTTGKKKQPLKKALPVWLAGRGTSMQNTACTFKNQFSSVVEKPCHPAWWISLILYDQCFNFLHVCLGCFVAGPASSLYLSRLSRCYDNKEFDI